VWQPLTRPVIPIRPSFSADNLRVWERDHHLASISVKYSCSDSNVLHIDIQSQRRHSRSGFWVSMAIANIEVLPVRITRLWVRGIVKDWRVERCFIRVAIDIAIGLYAMDLSLYWIWTKYRRKFHRFYLNDFSTTFLIRHPCISLFSRLSCCGFPQFSWRQGESTSNTTV